MTVMHQIRKGAIDETEKSAGKGKHIVIISGSPLSALAKTHFMKIHQIGN